MEVEVSLELRKIKLLRPVAPEFKISSPFGKRIINGKEEFHKGVDFACPEGTLIRACADGAAFRVGWEDDLNHKQGYGYRVWQEIKVGESRFYLWYGHTSKITIEEGAHIKQGQDIAFSGNSGRTTGPHLHIGCRLRDTSEFFDIEFVNA